MSSKPSSLKFLVTGVGIGILIALVAVAAIMPSMMILSMPSQHDFDTTMKMIQDGAKREKWSVMGTMDFQKKLSEKGFPLAQRVTSVQICKGDYAFPILQKHKWVATMMPCSLAVWEDDKGKVFVSKMNTGVMGKLFGGIIAEIMGGKVTADEERILKGIVSH